MNVKLTRAAQRDLAAQIDWLKSLSPSAGRRAAQAIVDALDLLRSFPDAGGLIEPQRREKHVRFGQYGFVIAYERHASVIYVTRIYHGAQDRSRP